MRENMKELIRCWLERAKSLREAAVTAGAENHYLGQILGSTACTYEQCADEAMKAISEEG